ncbi:hypothetical protein, partial [Dyella mobilis]|uniref:hypothetical protein n=1 Tax=Dyella mobilis TaxID=1849582 RepID=UPI0024E17C54
PTLQRDLPFSQPDGGTFKLKDFSNVDENFENYSNPYDIFSNNKYNIGVLRVLKENLFPGDIGEVLKYRLLLDTISLKLLEFYLSTHIGAYKKNDTTCVVWFFKENLQPG